MECPLLEERPLRCETLQDVESEMVGNHISKVLRPSQYIHIYGTFHLNYNVYHQKNLG